MRLHLIIQRHGLPVTRILWATPSPSSLASSIANPRASSYIPSSSALTPARTSIVAFGNDAYTVAHLLEDVSEIVPLETEEGPLDSNGDPSGQWGLEDYVVEVSGFECLHFVEVEGLLRDGDEVVIRALQAGDLQARRLSGRHQISSDGRHLIDGVPFGRPYLKRSFPSRPSIKIPPRKRRRTTLSGWGMSPYHHEEENADWEVPHRSTHKELSLLPEDAVDLDQGKVIKHDGTDFNDFQASDSDADTSDFEDEDLTKELEILKQDLHNSEALGLDPNSPRATRSSGRLSRLSYCIPTKISPSPTHTPRSISPISHSHDDALSPAESLPKTSKNVRFDQKVESEISSPTSPEDSPESVEEDSGSGSSGASDDSETSDDLSDTSSCVSGSESEPEVVRKPIPKAPPKLNPPGQGSPRTKKSNRRNKLRRRLVKLKELGHLPADAGFAALRAWEAANGIGGPLAEVTDVSESRSPQTREQSEFELRRQRLLQELEFGNIDVDGHSEKENIPPQYRNGNPSPQIEPPAGANETEATASCAVDSTNQELAEPSRKRTLDMASSRRLLFGSLGVKIPKSKEDEEATRQKLAGQGRSPLSLPRKPYEEAVDEHLSDLDENWQEKLIVKATECVYDNVELSTPPFPFKQRWDAEAQELIRKRKGDDRKERKNSLKTRDYEDEGDENENDNDDIELDYDDQHLDLPANGNLVTQQTDVSLVDLPVLLGDPTRVPDLIEGEMRKGAIIAFKQLDMSKATGWQPQVSRYRVAEVEGQAEDGSFRIQLAKRDREQPRQDLDQDTSRRQYAGFEMPGFEDEWTEDDGFREVSFRDLIDPKLLQAAQPAGATDEVVGCLEASLCDREDTMLCDNDLTSLSDLTRLVNPQPQFVSSQTRNEILQIIHDAGFRSNLNSELLDLDNYPPKGLPETNQLQDDDVDVLDSDVGSSILSPTFTGFPSSPPNIDSVERLFEYHSSSQLTPRPAASRDVTLGDNDQAPHTEEPARFSGPDLCRNARLTSQDSQLSMPDKSSRMISSPLGGAIDDTENHGEAQLEPTTTLPLCPTRPGSAQSAVPPTSSQGHQSISPTSSVVPNPFYENDMNEEKNADELDLNDELLPSDLPSLETLLMSTAPPQVTRRDKSPSLKSKRQASSSPLRATDGLSNSPAASAKGDGEAVGSTQPMAVVDLTASSPPQSPGGSDEDFATSQGLPHGPGWIRKNLAVTQRRTRSSTWGLTLNESSISPPPTRQGRRRQGLQNN